MSYLQTSCKLTQSLRSYGTMIPEDSLKPNPVERERRKPTGWGTRHTVIAMGFWGFAMSYAMRVNLSIAIVAMVRRNDSGPVPPIVPSHLSFHAPPRDYEFTFGNSTGETTCPIPQHSSGMAISNTTLPPSGGGDSSGEFNWNEVEQGIILGSFFYGYMITQLPGGILSQKYGGKWPLGLGIFITAVFALLTPIAARTHVSLLIAARIIQGLGEGLCTPAMHNLLGYWAPPNERGFMAGVTYSGTSFGTAATLIASGYIIHGDILGGWPGVFYIIGGISVLWFVLWCVLVYDTPTAHPRISGEELYYIQSSIGNQISKKKLSTPWKSIFKSGPLWVIVVAHTGHTWGLYTLLTELPTYMRSILNFDIKQNSWMSALPYGVMWITAFVIPMMAEVFVKKNWLTTGSVRKICQIIAHFGAALALIGASYSGCDATLTIFLLTVAVSLNGASFAGFGVNHVDIAANHAGVLMGITNTVANISGFVAPYVAGLLINGHSTLERWQYVFYIAAGVYIVDTIIYLCFASSEEQSWNREIGIPRTPPPSLANDREHLITTVPEEDLQHHTVTSDEESSQNEQNNRDIIRV